MATLRRALGSIVLMLSVGTVCADAQARARVTEEIRVLQTYPFSEPNRVPILTSDARLYPYHSFEGYAHDPVPREWKVVRLENDHIEVFVLPEVGGKVWGAVVKETGHEFIYRNEVMKFRNIALRGPWTSGGVEFNFGVIGHTPATATPVDYLTRENPDGSASVFVGAMDLPSRTHWRVEIRLPADRAYFETNALWRNPTPLEQPYYNWMTAAAFARDDLELSVPGDAYLEHPGTERAWPVDPSGRRLPRYAENRFGGNKSYHVVGELNDFFGGYYRDDDYGFGHWSPYEQMPGQKIWLWALSRQGGIWEDLLTDSDGQYVEFQAGRLFVQYAPGPEVNPISQVGFDPGATDRWTETWFPVEGLGGVSDASRDGAVFVERMGDELRVRAHAFGALADTLRISSGGRALAARPVRFEVLEPVEHVVELAAEDDFVVELPSLGLEVHSDPSARSLARPFTTAPGALESIPEVDRLVTAARELVMGRRLGEARPLFEDALAAEPWNRDALLGMADLEYRRGRYASGLERVERALQLRAYDAAANFVAGNLYRALGRDLDAEEAFGWAARSMGFRSAAYVQLAELALSRSDIPEAERYARLALDYDRHALAARRVLAVGARLTGDAATARAVRAEMLEIDPLHHFVAAERHLERRDAQAGRALLDGLRGEYPEQELLELAIAYARVGATDDGVALLALDERYRDHPVLGAWRAHLADDADLLPGDPDPAFVFPYRHETIAVLEWAAERSSAWGWRYLLALNLWARDRTTEAAAHLEAVGAEPDFAPAYVTRAHLLAAERDRDGEGDLRRAVALDPADRLLRIHLVRYLQEAGRWPDALATSAAGREDFPDDFNLSLLHVRSLVELDRATEAIDILEGIEVLPSEHAGASHDLFVQAHLSAALRAMQRSEPAGAERHARLALTWPENLGQGRPYEPEERLARYVLGMATGDADAFEAVVDGSAFRVSDRLALLAIPSLVALGRSSELGRLGAGSDAPAAAFARGLVAAVRSGETPHAAAARLADSTSALFADVEGRLLLGALSLEVPETR